jgi:hypothetical protein
MKADVQKMLGVAVITCGITLVAFWPAFTNATDDGNGITRKIEAPSLKIGGVEIRVEPLEDRTFKAGDEPAFVLTAVNKTDHATSVTVETVMNTSPKPMRMSRAVARPANLWQEPITLSLGPKESKTITQFTHTPLPKDSRIEVYANDTSMMSISTIAASDSQH